MSRGHHALGHWERRDEVALRRTHEKVSRAQAAVKPDVIMTSVACSIVMKSQ